MKFLFYAVLFLSFFGQSCKNKRLSVEEYAQLSDEERRNPKHALDGIDLLDDDLEVTLFASEPMMTNPTNMDIDAKGRVWICEAYNYRNELNPKNPYNKKGDRILIMEDTNQDGKADTSKVFYQGEDINAALGISVLGNKIIVSCSPNVYLFTDENGDDIPEKKEILFSGIGGLQHDHGIHAFTFGPDGKLYFNFGNSGEGIADKNGKPLVDYLGRKLANEGKPYQEGMVFRCNLDGSNVEALAWNFRNPYEVAVDSYGRMWQSDNDDDGNRATRINNVMDFGNYGFKDEMTRADWRVRRTNMEDSVFHQHWHLNDPGVVPNMLQTYAGSPTGMVVYEGKLLPEKYQNQVIHCDAGPNIVRAYPTQKSGAGFTAEIINILDGKSRDQWFRPSDVTVAPDGSLFVADWYDPGVGGHAMGDSLRGRVFRIAPKKSKYSVPTYNFSTPEGCVEALQNPNLSVRYLAWKALNTFQDKAEKALLSLWKSDDSHQQARALWLLGNIKGKETTYLSEAIKHTDEDIRATAVRLLRQLPLDGTSFYEKLAKDASPQVRREVALAIRHKNLPQIWVNLANQYDGKDRWYLEALGISADNQWDAYLAEWLTQNGENWNKTAAQRNIVWRSRAENTLFKLAEMMEKGSPSEKLSYYRAFDFQKNTKKNEVLLTLLQKSTSPDEKVIIFKHFDGDIKKNKTFTALLPSVLESIKKPTDYLDIVKKYNVPNQTEKLLSMTKQEGKLATEAAQTLLYLNGLADFKKIIATENEENQIKAIQTFGSVDTPIVTNYLIDLFSNSKLDVTLRKEAMKAMNGWESEATLWELVQKNKVPDDVLPEAKQLLLGTWHSDIRVAANKLFGNTNQATALNVAELIKTNGNAEKGKATFEMYCISCHMVNKKGVDFGPGLSQIGAKLAKQGLFNAIINPSEGISFAYEGSIIKLKDGSEIQGIITSKTENEYMIKFPGMAETKPYKRSDVVSVTEMKESLMPAFPLEKQELIDLVEYMTTLK